MFQPPPKKKFKPTYYKLYQPLQKLKKKPPVQMMTNQRLMWIDLSHNPLVSEMSFRLKTERHNSRKSHAEKLYERAVLFDGIPTLLSDVMGMGAIAALLNVASPLCVIQHRIEEQLSESEDDIFVFNTTDMIYHFLRCSRRWTTAK